MIIYYVVLYVIIEVDMGDKYALYYMYLIKNLGLEYFITCVSVTFTLNAR